MRFEPFRIQRQLMGVSETSPQRSRTMNTQTSQRYELRFQSLFDEGRGLAFDCDAGGHVNLDTLSERARTNYFYARTVIGREFSMPRVESRVVH
jgi:hypothetical protein